VAKGLGAHCRTRLFRFIGDEQAKNLPAPARRERGRPRFKWSGELPAGVATVLILDDVYATGLSLSRVANLLRRHRPGIRILVVAMTPLCTHDNEERAHVWRSAAVCPSRHAWGRQILPASEA
jgi:predicted amidophosphoribosyltransferase